MPSQAELDHFASQDRYVFTLDSHDCFGPFASEQMAVGWGKKHRPTFQVLSKVPAFTTVLKPF